MEFITHNWQLIALLLLGALSFVVPALRGLWTMAFKALMSEAFLKKVFIMLAEDLVKSTKNPLDDLWLQELKKTLNLPRSDPGK